MNSLDRFLGKSAPEPNSGCWLWLGQIDKDGYGRVKIGSRKIAAHRISYEALRGPIDPGKTLDHKCRVHCCINPDHLEPVSKRENTIRGVSIVALRANATHCKNGHEFTPGNTRVTKRGHRNCRTCQREYQRLRSPSPSVSALRVTPPIA